MASKTKSSRRIIDTTSGGLPKIVAKLAFPAALQAMLINIYAFNDFVFVGMLGDKAATAALSACFAVLIIKYAVIRIMPTGGTTLVAQFSGAGNVDEVSDTCRQSLFISVLWAVVVGAVGLSILGPIVAASNVTTEVGIKIADYLRVLFWAAPAFGLMIMIDGTFRARGDTKTPLFLEVLSLIVNTILNWVLVLGNLGFAPMGIEGAAIATAISRAIPGIMGLILVFRGALNFEIAAPFERWIPSKIRLFKMFRIGLFDSLGAIVYGFTYMALYRIAGQISTAAQGGLGAGLRGIEWIGFSLGDGFAQGALVIVGQNLGAQKPERARRGVWITAIAGFIISQFVGFMFVLFPEQLCSLVTQDPETLHYAAEYVSICGWVQGICSFEMIIYGSLIGAGRSETTFAISGITNFVRIPIAAAMVFGLACTAGATLWAFTGVGTSGAVVGGFDGICYAIASTTIIKGGIYFFLVAFLNPFTTPVIDVHSPIELDPTTPK